MPPLFSTPDTHKTSLQYFSAYELPSVEAPVRYLHADIDFPVRDTRLKSINTGKSASWTGLAYQNSAKFYPIACENLKVHMVQVRQRFRSTNPKTQRIKYKLTEATNIYSDMTPSHEVHIKVEHIRNIYTDDNGRVPVLSQSGNQYIMIAYHCDYNAIFAVPFKSYVDKHRLIAYGAIIQRPDDCNMLVDLQILDKNYWIQAHHQG